MPRKLTLAQFIEKALAVHGERYSYLKSKYVNSQTPIIITCAIHGDFPQRPHDHLQGKGCPKCSKTAPITLKSFLERSKAAHGDKYDYSLVVIGKANDLVSIICPHHGEFKQTIHNHIAGKGCRKCSGKCTEQSQQKVRDKAQELGYSVDQAGYVNNEQKLSFTCSLGHEFSMSSSNFLGGKRCPKCAHTDIEKAKIRFHQLAKKNGFTILGEYKKAVLKVDMVCKNGHKFSMTPNNLANGKGCHVCANQDQQQAYINEVLETGFIKYGIARCCDVRLKAQNGRNTFKMKRIARWIFPSVDLCKTAETECKRLFTPVLSKSDMVDGWTETTFAHAYERIQAIYEKHQGVLMTDANQACEVL